MGIFKITADDLQWIGGAVDDPQDLCLHGHVTVQFGDTILEDTGTISATALYLLKTLTEDKLMAEYDIQMIPCCGHTFIANVNMTEVQISGCDTGTDWSTIMRAIPSGLFSPPGRKRLWRFVNISTRCWISPRKSNASMIPAPRRKSRRMSLTGMDTRLSGTSGSGAITKD